MIETECFRELNVMEENGELVLDLRNDSIRGENSKSESNNKFGFLARLFKRKVCLHHIFLSFIISNLI